MILKRFGEMYMNNVAILVNLHCFDTSRGSVSPMNNVSILECLRSVAMSIVKGMSMILIAGNL